MSLGFRPGASLGSVTGPTAPRQRLAALHGQLRWQLPNLPWQIRIIPDGTVVLVFCNMLQYGDSTLRSCTARVRSPLGGSHIIQWP